MTDTTAESVSAKAPIHVAYHLRDREGKKGIGTRVGTAWLHADGKGFNVQIDVAPLDGPITHRVPSD
jgi:hypothetical protein